jgi:hypothetical protein
VFPLQWVVQCFSAIDLMTLPLMLPLTASPSTSCCAQVALMACPWPEEVLATPLCAPVYVRVAGGATFKGNSLSGTGTPGAKAKLVKVMVSVQGAHTCMRPCVPPVPEYTLLTCSATPWQEGIELQVVHALVQDANAAFGGLGCVGLLAFGCLLLH